MLVVAVALLLLLLVLAAVFHVFLGWPLLLGVGIFALCAKGQGKTRGEIGRMLADGLKKAWIVIQVLIVIGLLTASWIACGTIPYLVRLGALLIQPHVFLVCCFWLCAAMSFLLGTSFGTANTVGMVLITIARARRCQHSHDCWRHPVRHLLWGPGQPHVLIPASVVHPQ